MRLLRSNALLLVFSVAALAVTGCGGGSSGSGTSGSASTVAPTTTKATTGPVTSSGTPQTKPTPAPTAKPVPSPSPVAAGTTQRYLYSANSGDNTVGAFSINATTGDLKAIGSVSPGATSAPWALASDSAGKFVFSVDAADVAPFMVDPATGGLKAIGAAPITTGLSTPWNACVSPDGAFLLVTNFGNNTVTSFKIAATGDLTLGFTLSLPATAGSPYDVIVDPSSKFAYVTDGNSGDLQPLTIEAGTGKLALAGAAVIGGGPRGLAFDPAGKFLFVADQTKGTIQGYSVAATGALTAVGTALSMGTGATGRAIAVTADGKRLYATDSTNDKVFGAAIDATGNLTALSATPTAATGTLATALAVEGSGQFAYAANYLSDDISIFTLDKTTGAPTAKTAFKITPAAGSTYPAPHGLALVK